MKKILLLGATGLIGQHFIRAFHKAFEITVISTKPKKAKKLFPTLACYAWDVLTKRGFIDQFEVVINLAGANVGDKKWSYSRMKLLKESRTETTHKVVDAILAAKEPPRLLNASAIGIYGFHSSLHHQMLVSFNETNDVDVGQSSFSKRLVTAWEAELMRLSDKALPFVCLRFGTVLAPWGGALKKMMGAFSWGLGGKVGSGRQPMSWVHINDCVRAIYFLIMRPSIRGPVNIVAPEVVSNQTFSKVLAEVMSTHAYFSKPSWLVWLLFGQMGRELLLNGQYVKPKVLERAGFKFTHPQLREALVQLLH